MAIKKGEIVVVGLGPGGFENIPPYNLRILKETGKVFLRTSRHPGVEKLPDEGIKFQTFDYLYDELTHFEDVYEHIATTLLKEYNREAETVAYAVPGNPTVAESSVEKLLQKAKDNCINIKIIPAASGLEAVYAALKIDPTSGLFITDALKLDKNSLQARMSLLVTQVYNRMVASDLKLTLMDYYDDEHPVTLVRAAGVENEEIIETMPLFEIDRREWVDHLTSLYVPGLTPALYPLDPIVNVMDKLRGPDGCPWDKEQTHQSLKRYLIEETYEVIEAIEENNMYKLREELGDLLLQIVFHARLAKENDSFTINDVIAEITEKMIRRHPHVFRELNLKTAGEVKKTWEKIKQEEKKESEQQSIIDVPRGLPALLRAEKIQSKVSKVGFDWPDIRGPREKVHEELHELQEAQEKGDKDNTFEEVGDVLFAVVNYARFLKVDPEEALTYTINKFVKRFRYIEKVAGEKNLSLENMSLQEMDKLWNEAKNLFIK